MYGMPGENRNEHSSFINEPLRDFSEAHHREAIRDALDSLEQRRHHAPLVSMPIINGQELRRGERFLRFDPSNTAVLLGEIYCGDTFDADNAVASCRHGFNQLYNSSTGQRVERLRLLAKLMREQKAALTALIIREVGKPWREADADVAEAIDFCEYYAHEMVTTWQPRRTEAVLGEENHYIYQGRGVAVVISPWNFPLAITCGMAVAALVAGNTVILKPAEQASLIAYEFAKLVLAAGFPPNTFAFLPGYGEVIGRHLVAHPDVDLIAFTGSRAVGLEILSTANKVAKGQHSIKRVIAELGGKNAIIVDENADMDDAIRGVLHSAFGFAGQKCSACSRLIVVGATYEPFLQRLGDATRDLLIGPAEESATTVGPVIDAESCDRIENLVRAASASVPLVVRSVMDEGLAKHGYYVAPTIFRDVPLEHTLWINEIFGPVLSCVNAPTFSKALEMTMASEYALTGGVFSRNPTNLALARREFRVGNLYINRGITGALVRRQPFGGFKFSGIGSKAGGPDYLMQFMEPRVVTENIMRRGFSPDLA